MQFRDLKTQYLCHKTGIDNAIERVLLSTSFIMGPQVSELESILSEYVGVKHCVTCANGTDALQLALMAWNIGPGDAVFVPDFTFFSSAEVISCVGAMPVFVDIEESTFNISSGALREAIEYVVHETELIPKAVIAVDLFGQPADYSTIKQICTNYELLLLEDGAQGFGGRIGEKKACSFGDISTTSFFPAKPLGCYGDGGAIFTDNDEWDKIIRSYRVHGKGVDKYDNIRIGMNSRLDTLQASILLEKIKFFDEEIDKCQQIVEWYEDRFKTCPEILVPKVKKGRYSSWAQYTILLKNETIRDKVMHELKINGIPSMVYYRKPMHEQTAFLNNSISTRCLVSSAVSKRCLSLPMGAYMVEEDVERIAALVCEWSIK